MLNKVVLPIPCRKESLPSVAELEKMHIITIKACNGISCDRDTVFESLIELVELRLRKLSKSNKVIKTLELYELNLHNWSFLASWMIQYRIHEFNLYWCHLTDRAAETLGSVLEFGSTVQMLNLVHLRGSNSWKMGLKFNESLTQVDFTNLDCGPIWQELFYMIQHSNRLKHLTCQMNRIFDTHFVEVENSSALGCRTSPPLQSFVLQLGNEDDNENHNPNVLSPTPLNLPINFCKMMGQVLRSAKNLSYLKVGITAPTTSTEESTHHDPLPYDFLKDAINVQSLELHGIQHLDPYTLQYLMYLGNLKELTLVYDEEKDAAKTRQLLGMVDLSSLRVLCMAP